MAGNRAQELKELLESFKRNKEHGLGVAVLVLLLIYLEIRELLKKIREKKW